MPVSASYAVVYTPAPAGGRPSNWHPVTVLPDKYFGGAYSWLCPITPVTNGGTLNFTFNGQNPARGGDLACRHHEPATGTTVSTSSITLGNSVTSVSGEPGVGASSAATTSTKVDFRNIEVAGAARGDIFLSEVAGPTNFSQSGSGSAR